MELVFYRTYSYGGCDGRELEKRDFQTEELARKDAELDTWNSDFDLYEITLTIAGKVTETSKLIEKGILCGRDEYWKAIEKGEEPQKKPTRHEYYSSLDLPTDYISYYQTSSWGGCDGRERVQRFFETEEAALEDALKNTWNDTFYLSLVEMVLSGTITRKTTGLREIPCGRYLKFANNNESTKKL